MYTGTCGIWPALASKAIQKNKKRKGSHKALTNPLIVLVPFAIARMAKTNKITVMPKLW
jgi:hypothetical protein